MQTSLFIAKLMGPILALFGLLMLIRREVFVDIARELIASRAMLFLAGILTLAAGLAIVNTHNVWVLGWPVIITVFGWLAVIGGVMRIALPDKIRGMGEAMLESRSFISFDAVAVTALGAFLAYQGYLG